MPCHLTRVSSKSPKCFQLLQPPKTRVSWESPDVCPFKGLRSQLGWKVSGVGTSTNPRSEMLYSKLFHISYGISFTDQTGSLICDFQHTTFIHFPSFRCLVGSFFHSTRSTHDMSWILARTTADDIRLTINRGWLPDALDKDFLISSENWERNNTRQSVLPIFETRMVFSERRSLDTGLWTPRFLESGHLAVAI